MKIIIEDKDIPMFLEPLQQYINSKKKEQRELDDDCEFLAFTNYDEEDE